MKRYSIHVGEEFPAETEPPPRHRGPLGPFGIPRGVLRWLFIFALAMVVIRYPARTAILLGVLLLWGRRHEGFAWGSAAAAPWLARARDWLADLIRGIGEPQVGPMGGPMGDPRWNRAANGGPQAQARGWHARGGCGRSRWGGRWRDGGDGGAFV